MNLPATRLQRILNEAPVPFNLGDYISRGFQFMNQNFGMLLGFTLVSILISFIAQVIPIVGIFLSMLITPVLQIGYAQFTYASIRERRVDFNEFFKGFNKIWMLLATYLLTVIVSLLALLPGLIFWYQAGVFDWFMGMMEEYPFIESVPELGDSVDMTLFWLGTLAVFIGGITLTILFAWSLNIVWFFNVGPVEALSASRKLIARNWVSFVLFYIITGFITLCGVLLCGIGFLYTAPAMACAHFFAFADATQILEDDDNQPDIIDHFIA